MNVIRNYGEFEIINNDNDTYITTIIKTKIFNELFLMSVGVCNGGYFEQDKLKYDSDFSEDENLQNFIEYLTEISNQ
mgnify:CR=1 FL=1